MQITAKSSPDSADVKKVLYITTRGMDIKTGEALEQATPYIRALSRLWGARRTFGSGGREYGLQHARKQIELKIRDGIEKGLKIAENF